VCACSFETTIDVQHVTGAKPHPQKKSRRAYPATDKVLGFKIRNTQHLGDRECTGRVAVPFSSKSLRGSSTAHSHIRARASALRLCLFGRARCMQGSDRHSAAPVDPSDRGNAYPFDSRRTLALTFLR
jgi:hypothetical protein